MRLNLFRDLIQVGTMPIKSVPYCYVMLVTGWYALSAITNEVQVIAERA
jgi:hypothetical protein